MTTAPSTVRRRVIVEVSEEGLAEVTECPADVEVVIRDWYSIKEGNPDPMADKEFVCGACCGLFPTEFKYSSYVGDICEDCFNGGTDKGDLLV